MALFTMFARRATWRRLGVLPALLPLLAVCSANWSSANWSSANWRSDYWGS